MSDITQIQVGTTTYTITDEIANNNINTLSTSLYSLTTSLSSMAYQSDVPSDNKQYIRRNGNWEEISISNSTNWNNIINKPNTFPPETHNHDDRYYTESETDTLLEAKADTSSLGDLAYEDSVDYSDVTNTPTLGSLASLNSIDYTGNLITNKPTLGSLADQDTVNYETEVTNKPTLGSLASKNTVDWDTDINDIPSTFPPSTHTHDDRYYTESEVDSLLANKTNTADLGDLAFEDSIDYSNIQNIPTLGSLASKNTVDYTTDITNKPTLGTLSSKDDVPNDNKEYIRKNGSWSEISNNSNIIISVSNETMYFTF